MKPLCAALLLAASLAAPAFIPVFAHAMLLQSSPANGAAVAPPTNISLIFTEEVQNNVAVTIARDGAPVPMGAVSLAPNFSVITVTPAAPFAPGNYVVTWHNTARDDGHKANGSFSFTVKTP